MKMPNRKSAVVDAGKLLDYCLNPAHPRGRHKARVSTASLGLTSANADRLRDALLNSACSDDAISGELDGYGQRYVVDFTMSTAAGQADIRSAWMVRRGEEFPRLLSCYVLSANAEEYEQNQSS